MRTYAERKAAARAKAARYQRILPPEKEIDRWRRYQWEAYFYGLGRRYGLVHEFRKMGIIS